MACRRAVVFGGGRGVWLAFECVGGVVKYAHPRVRIKTEMVRQIMAERGLSQNSVSLLCGLSKGYLSQLMNGTRFAGPLARQAIQTKLRVREWDDLWEIEGRAAHGLIADETDASRSNRPRPRKITTVTVQEIGFRQSWASSIQTLSTSEREGALRGMILACDPSEPGLLRQLRKELRREIVGDRR